MRSMLDGSNITVLVKDVKEVSSVTVDPYENKVFFAFDKQIDVCDMDGRNR